MVFVGMGVFISSIGLILKGLFNFIDLVTSKTRGTSAGQKCQFCICCLRNLLQVLPCADTS